MLSPIVRLLRFASIVICLIVIASFAAFAVEQTKTASGHQQESLATSGAGGPAPSPAAKGTSAHHEGAARKTLDEVSGQLTSPFAGVVSGSSSEWATRGFELLAALVVYGFGLGFLARTLRVRI